MFNYLEHLRRQPLRTRKKIALIAAAGGTAVILLFWLVALLGREPAPAAVTIDKKGPIETMGDSIGSLFSDTASAFRSIRSAFSLEEETYTATSTTPAEAAVNE